METLTLRSSAAPPHYYPASSIQHRVSSIQYQVSRKIIATGSSTFEIKKKLDKALVGRAFSKL